MFDTTVMTFESSIKIFDVAITKIFDSVDMFFDSAGFDAAADMVFDAAADMVFDAAADVIFEFAAKIFDLADMVFDSVPDRKFDLGVRGNSTPASQEIRPRRLRKFDPGVPGNSTPASQEI
jgi:hypothetical protein